MMVSSSEKGGIYRFMTFHDAWTKNIACIHVDSGDLMQPTIAQLLKWFEGKEMEYILQVNFS